jgi:hypothetical protein
MLLEACGERAKRAAGAARQTFDCGDSHAIGLCGQHQTGSNRCAINNDGARPAYTVLTTDMGTCELKMVTERIGQAGARFEVELDLLAVDGEASGRGRHYANSATFSPAAWPKALSSRTPNKARR